MGKYKAYCSIPFCIIWVHLYSWNSWLFSDGYSQLNTFASISQVWIRHRSVSKEWRLLFQGLYLHRTQEELTCLRTSLLGSFPIETIIVYMQRYSLFQCRSYEVRGPTAVLCKTCSVLLYVLEQQIVDNSSVGSNWGKLVQLSSVRPYRLLD